MPFTAHCKGLISTVDRSYSSLPPNQENKAMALPLTETPITTNSSDDEPAHLAL